MGEVTDRHREDIRQAMLTPRITRLPCGHFGDYDAVMESGALALAEAEERGRRERDAEVNELRRLLLTRIEASRLDEANAEIASLRAQVKALEERHAANITPTIRALATQANDAQSQGFRRGLEAAAEFTREHRAAFCMVAMRWVADPNSERAPMPDAMQIAMADAIRQIKETP